VCAAAQGKHPAFRRDCEWIEAQPDRFVLALGTPEYPEALAQMHDPPPVLLGRGDPAALAMPAVAIVGSRSATPGALDRAHLLAGALGHAGLCVVSGLALGIDGAAHRGALAAGTPTVAVLGCGVDRVYPPAHARLAAGVARHGALISELPVGAQPRPANFPRRNRVIAGLSLATVVVEAGLRSGALITAQIAAELGRDVLAVPGAVENPLARGCHALLKDGAGLVEDAADVLAALAGRFTPRSPAAAAPGTEPTRPAGTNEETGRLLACIEGAPAALDEIVARCGLTASRVSSMLLLLELEGAVAALPGGRFARRSPRGHE
jgi:DNA processing protein